MRAVETFQRDARTPATATAAATLSMHAISRVTPDEHAGYRGCGLYQAFSRVLRILKTREKWRISSGLPSIVCNVEMCSSLEVAPPHGGAERVFVNTTLKFQCRCSTRQGRGSDAVPPSIASGIDCKRAAKPFPNRVHTPFNRWQFSSTPKGLASCLTD